MKKYPLFTSQQLASATGTSRSKILRIEDTGLIAPDNRDGSAYARHYDIYTAVKLFGILNYHNLGFTRKQTVKHFDENEDYSEAIAVLENKIKVMNDVLYSLKIRTGKEMHNVIREESDIDSYYYIKQAGGSNLGEIWDDILTVLSEAMLHGYEIRYERPISVKAEFSSSNKCRYFVCIPIADNSADGDTVLFEASDKVFMTWFGSFNEPGKAFGELKKYASDRNLKYDNSLTVDILTMPYEKEKFDSDELVYKISLSVNK